MSTHDKEEVQRDNSLTAAFTINLDVHRNTLTLINLEVLQRAGYMYGNNAIQCGKYMDTRKRE